MHLLEADSVLVEVLRALPDVPAAARLDVAALIARAERHGLAGVVHDALAGASIRGATNVEREVAWRQAARELDHAAHLEMLSTIDNALAQRGLVAVALKGPLLAERLYSHPAARATSDIDLLVDEAKLEATAAALVDVGYVGAEGPEEERYRREHHHLHFHHPHALPLELHFHAYRGFGHTLPSEPLVTRSEAYRTRELRAIGVLAPEDELVFLAVHAAAHRFVRLGWLYDLKLLLATLSYDQRLVAVRRATAWGYGRALSFAAQLLNTVLGVDTVSMQPLLRDERRRAQLTDALVTEPLAPLRRAATRFLYSLALCDSPRAALRYSRTAVSSYAARATGVGR